MNDGVSWNVSTPNVCSTTFPTSAEMPLVMACVARVVMMSVCVWLGFCSARSSGAMSCVPVRRASLNSYATTSDVGSGGSELSVELSWALVPVKPTVTR